MECSFCGEDCGHRSDEIDMLRRGLDAIDSRHVLTDGRYLILCDDDSLVGTDQLMPGDFVLIDRGEGQ